MIGDRSRLPFGLLLSLRAALGSQRRFAGISLLAVSLSVCLAVGLQLSFAAVSTQLERDEQALRGYTDLEITSGEVGIPEDLLVVVQRVDGVEAAGPVIESSVRLDDGSGSDLALHLIGVDLVEDARLRTYSVSSTELTVLDPLRLISLTDSVVIPSSLASRISAREGDSLRITSANGVHELVVRGILSPGGVADAFGGQIAVMDVYALQEMLGMRGWLDRIDITLDPQFDIETVTNALKALVGDRAVVRPADRSDPFVLTALRTIRLAGLIITGTGIAAAAVLTYGAITISIRRRRREFGLLRAAGLEASRARKLVMSEALAVASGGTAIGLILGWFVGKVLLTGFNQTSRLITGTEGAAIEMGVATLAIGLVVGVGVSLVSAYIPARRVGIDDPLSQLALSESQVDPEAKRSLTLGLVLTLLFGVVTWVELPILAVVQAAVVLALGLAALAMLLGPILGWLASAARVIAQLFWPGWALVVARALRSRTRQDRLAVAGVATVVASATAVLAVVQSLPATLDRTYRETGEIVITGSDIRRSYERTPIRQETVDVIRSTPGVRAVMGHYTTQVLYGGERVALSAVSARVLGENGRQSYLEGGTTRQVMAGLTRGGVAVSQSFAHYFDVGVGDRIELATPSGNRGFPVVGIRELYANFGRTGSIHLDLDVFDEIWPRSGYYNLVIWPEGRPDHVIDQVRRRVAGGQLLFFAEGRDLADFARRQVEDANALLLLLVALTAGLGGVSILNLLFGALQDWRRDLALFRAGGATSGQLSALVVADGIAIAAIGTIAGMGMGLACARSILRVLTESFGWVVTLSVDWLQLAGAGLGVVLVSAIITAYPGWQARRLAVGEVLGNE
jgi:putative ABC transport system permease protein